MSKTFSDCTLERRGERGEGRGGFEREREREKEGRGEELRGDKLVCGKKEESRMWEREINKCRRVHETEGSEERGKKGVRGVEVYMRGGVKGKGV